MDNKLSELSKPVFEIEVSGAYWLNCTSGKLTPDAGADFSDWPDGVNRLYSQEYVSALLAELEAKEAKIVELRKRGINAVTAEERTSTEWQKRAEAAEQRIPELEEKLATPVRLQSPWADHLGNRWLLEGITVDAIRAAGFTVEGDE